MKTLILLIALIFLGSCTSSSNDYWASEKSKCKDKNKGTLAFREGCRNALHMGYSSQGDNFKRWCSCVEEKLAFQFLLTEECELRSQHTVVSLSNEDFAKVKCGTPKDPL